MNCRRDLGEVFIRVLRTVFSLLCSIMLIYDADGEPAPKERWICINIGSREPLGEGVM